MREQPESVSADERMKQCEDALGYRFRDRDLLKHCLTHSSSAITRLASNERLEFLGDAILGLVVCELLFQRFPEEPEGELTRLKSILVSRQTCARIASRLGLDKLLMLGRGVTATGRIPSSINAAGFEALVAGIYLDGGIEAAREVIERLIAPDVEKTVQKEHVTNYKSVLQQLSQKMTGQTPEYRVLDEKGPDHSKCFEVAAVIGRQSYPSAWGPSKKEAEQQAARNALVELEGEEFLKEVEDA